MPVHDEQVSEKRHYREGPGGVYYPPQAHDYSSEDYYGQHHYSEQQRQYLYHP